MEHTNGNFGFRIEKKLGGGSLGRAGVITTPHGQIETPAFIVVGTKATVKSLTPEQVKDLGAQAVLSNTYHLYLQPGDELVRDSGGLGKFMQWDGPTFTDSGGFQVFSLGAAFGKGVGKVTSQEENGESDGRSKADTQNHAQLAQVDDEGVTFKSHIDGSTHRFTPERSLQIQHNIGADIIVAFDECTSPLDPHDIQKRSLDRTHIWAKRSLAEHQRLMSRPRLDNGGEKTAPAYQALYGVIQGGKFQDLREEAARTIGAMDFDGFGIGGSFNKDDIGTAVRWVNALLPEDKPRHLLGIGEPIDFFLGVENGVDTFDCVSPTRLGRNGALYTNDGRINLNNAKFVTDLTPVEKDCGCYTCLNFTRAYLAHLFRADEMLAATLASVHNLYFIVNLVKKIRQSILDGRFDAYKTEMLGRYYA
jgi:queuine tRNA-ribosyltransferase